MPLQKSRLTLVLSALAILPFMFVVFKLTTSLYGIKQGYFAGFKYPSKINLTKFRFLFFDIQGIATGA